MRTNRNPFFSLAAVLLIALICFLSFWRLPKDQQVRSSTVRKPVIVEIIVPKDLVFNSEPLFDLAKGFALDLNDITQWKNRVSVYANIANSEEFFKRIKTEYLQDTVKYFDAPFYNFNRKTCADTVSPKKWDNILLSANLVSDPKLQQEYLNYHKTQFKRWPEVSRGFCQTNQTCKTGLGIINHSNDCFIPHF